MKKWISVCLALLLVLTLVPVTARAAEVASGTCGDNLTWVLDDQGILTISGTGAMEDYNSWSLPWKNHQYDIVQVVIGDGVTSIGKSAFYMLHNLERVTMSDDITAIGNSAFAYCDKLTEMVFSDNLITIGESAFYDCDGIKSLTLPQGVTTIGGSAFYDCDALESLTLSQDLITIGESAFYDCDGLESLTLPQGLTTIGGSAFYDCEKLTAAEFPESLTTLGERAFYECDALVSVKFRNSAAAIGDFAFYSCSNLSSLDLSDSIVAIEKAAFKYCVKLVRAEIPGTVSAIGEEAFLGCEKLDRLTLGEGVEVIGASAFESCLNLSRVTFPNSVVTIDTSAFSGCGSLTDVTIPDSVETIGESAFYNCHEMKTLTIGNGVTTIGDRAFSSCYDLTDVTLGSSIKTIGNYAFAYCRSITRKMVIPGSVTTIGNNAFNSCERLVNVVIPDSVTTLGEEAFVGCGALEKVKLGNGISRINDSTFARCYKLSHVTIPGSVDTLGDYAFEGCSGLTSVTIPDSVDVILQKAFYNCGKLADVYYGGTEAEWEDISISQYNDDLRNANIHFGSYAGDILRLAGAHRWETALKVAEEMRVNLGIVQFDSVIIASGNDFADALAGSYLSTVKEAPILLSWGKGGNFEYLDHNNIWYIQEVLAPGGTVYILGGTSAVPELYENRLQNSSYQFNVVRLGGAHRFETNLMILEEAGVSQGDEILVCTSTNFADSLSASATGKPILLVWNEWGALYGRQPEYLENLQNCTFTVIGGESAVSKKLADAVGKYGRVARLAGNNRFETSVAVARAYFDAPESAVLAYAWNYPDGLCGGSLAFSMGAPLILTMTGYDKQAVAYANETGIGEGAVLGGTGLISDAAVRAIFAMDAGDKILLK